MEFTANFALHVCLNLPWLSLLFCFDCVTIVELHAKWGSVRSSSTDCLMTSVPDPHGIHLPGVDVSLGLFMLAH